MSWYYAEGNDRRGPIADNDWNGLLQNGTIQPGTLVWREGMTQWAPYSSVAGTTPPAPSNPGTIGNATEEGVRCSECGKLFPADEVVSIEGQPVCAGCKPIAVQKIKEGIHLSGSMHYASFWIRVGAKIIDSIIQQVVVRALAFFLGLGLGGAGITDPSTAAIIGGILGFGFAAGYSIFFNGKYGATPGKMACKLRILRPDGSPLGYGRACGRFFAEMLSGFTLCIGYLMVAFDEQKRALHDRICDTRVVHV